VVDEADECVLVDLTPQALRNRIERGVVYASEKARRALDNFFAEANLTALRELAIRHTAHEVEERLLAPRRDERILICLTGRRRRPTSSAAASAWRTTSAPIVWRFTWRHPKARARASSAT